MKFRCLVTKYPNTKQEEEEKTANEQVQSDPGHHEKLCSAGGFLKVDVTVGDRVPQERAQHQTSRDA